MNKYLITGSCGTVGSGLVNHILNNDENCEVRCLDNNESALFFQEQTYLKDKRVNFFLADIRDKDRLESLFKGVDIVFHAAALKHVVMCERSPMDSVQTNIHGVNNIINASLSADVRKVIFTSSDKAVNPTNVMGTSKLMGERLITSANLSQCDSDTIFASTRFGNVLGSNGSVIPIFKKQIQMGGPITLTDSNMTRFVMSVEQAVKLVVSSANIARGGEVFITKMPVLKIKDLAQVMIEELSDKYGFKPSEIEVIEVGSKPGEKLYEELMSDEEIRRAVELENYFSVLPAFRGIYRNINYDYKDIISNQVDNPYISQNESHMTHDEIREFLYKYNLLCDDELEQPDQRYWPGDKE
jgi:FlaA1/EpsC-like NDP-sugar epimerase